MTNPRRIPAAERFWGKVDKGRDLECWPWKGACNAGGYGMLRSGIGSDRYKSSKWVLAHRFSYELHKGRIPDGLEIDHTCRNRGCVNPAHLEAVSHRTNTLRGQSPTARQARQTHCLRGHEFTERNTRIESNGKRSCRECCRRRDRERYALHGARL